MSKLSSIRTEYVWANPKKCAACWQCVGSCPRQAIGKVSFLWHRHIVFKNAERCMGCKKCIKVCPYGVFSEEMPDVLGRFVKQPFL
ncbi:MAG: 4Fe-4S binding protein [Prevotellaceae bacterium]|nr:4Fe-4S binding protein [Prevotellaceae bacterium]